MQTNNNCNGSGPCLGETVKVLPTGGDGNAILCLACFNREMIWRRTRNLDLAEENKFQIKKWNDLKIYCA